MKSKGYKARITRKNPSAFIFMIDTSGSMENKVYFNGELVTKARAVATHINTILSEIIACCKREDGYRDYLDIAVIGYGGDEARSLLPEGNSHKIFRKPYELAHSKTKKTKIFRERVLENGQPITTVTESREWIQPLAIGKTPMYSALSGIYDLTKEWILKYADCECFPPVVINITDGEATDADDNDLIKLAEKLKSLHTRDGNVLFMNIYISADENSGILFPLSTGELPDKPYAKMLFEMSSDMPDMFHEEIKDITGKSNVAGCRGMSYNTSIADIVNMLNIGTISVNLLE